MGWDKEKSLLIREMIGSYCISIFKCRERKFVAARKTSPWVSMISMASKVCVKKKFKADL
jgi:hypothetical protein